MGEKYKSIRHSSDTFFFTTFTIRLVCIRVCTNKNCLCTFVFSLISQFHIDLLRSANNTRNLSDRNADGDVSVSTRTPMTSSGHGSMLAATSSSSSDRKYSIDPQAKVPIDKLKSVGIESMPLFF